MQRLVDDLLMLSSLENSNVAPSVEIISVTAMLQALLVEANAISGGRHRIELVGASTACLKGSASEIESASRNLLTNAIRYTPPDGCIRIEWLVSADEGVISVSDTGIGISPEHLPRLTERFYRVDRGRSRDNGGTGLGLAIVKHILQRHEASLRVTSTPGQGSTFALVFPSDRLVAASAPAMPAVAIR
jgi:two-component system phosphate regulon sensor histidine kinase PhoR